MNTRHILRVVPLLLVLALTPAIWAQECDPPEARECVETENDCDASADVTVKEVQLGGQGSPACQDDPCGGMPCEDPGRLTDGTLGQALMTFEYTRIGSGEGMLDVTVQNTTCSTSQIFDVGFNVSRDEWGVPRVSDMVLTGTASSSSPRGANNWVASFAPDACENRFQCFGYFDVGVANMDNTPGGEILAKDGAFEEVTFSFDVEGAEDLTACDFVVQASRVRGGGGCTGERPDKTTFAAAKFQRGYQGGSGTIGPCDGEGDLLVALGDFDVLSGNGAVTLRWETLFEYQTAGYQIYRTDLATGLSTLLNDRLIPARGGPTQSASYEYADTTAINGVKYKYFITEMDIFGTSTTLFPKVAVPNPSNTSIFIVAPPFDAIMSQGERGRLVFSTPLLGEFAVQVSADPTFTDSSQTVVLDGRSWKGDLSTATFGKKKARKLLQLALRGDGHLYWRVVQEGNERRGKEDSQQLGVGAISPTYRVAFD